MLRGYGRLNTSNVNPQFTDETLGTNFEATVLCFLGTTLLKIWHHFLIRVYKL